MFMRKKIREKKRRKGKIRKNRELLIKWCRKRVKVRKSFWSVENLVFWAILGKN